MFSPFPAVALNGVEAVGVELGRCTEEMRVVSHVEHTHVPHWPDADLLIAGPVDEDGMALVDAAGDVGVAAGAEDRGGAGVGVDAGEVGRGEREAAIRVVDGGGVVEKEGALGSGEAALLAAEDTRAQNLKRESTSGKKGGRSVPRRLFSKSNMPPTRPLVDTDLKKRAAVLSA